jgi:NADH-quinone oxidoreductase subunit N
VLLADLFVTDPQRRPTFWLTQATHRRLRRAAPAGLQRHHAYGMQGMVVVDPMGHLLAFFAALAVMITLAYARPRWHRATCSRASSSRSRCSCCWASR